MEKLRSSSVELHNKTKQIHLRRSKHAGMSASAWKFQGAKEDATLPEQTTNSESHHHALFTVLHKFGQSFAARQFDFANDTTVCNHKGHGDFKSHNNNFR